MKRCHHHIVTQLTAFAVMLLVSIASYAQQRVQFTQYMFSNAVINPAYVGSDEALSLTVIQRSQWVGMNNAPETQTLSAHTLFKKQHMGVGLLFLNDNIGVHRTTNAFTQFSYHLKVAAKSTLSMGLHAGIVSRRSDYASLIGNSSPDPKLVNPFVRHTFPDVGFGFYFRNERLNAGVSLPELLPETISVSDSVSLKFRRANCFIFSKYRITLNHALDFEPAILIKYLNGVPFSYDVNANFVYRKAITGGLAYRKKESIDFLFKAQVTHQLQFGYSYDYPLGVIASLGSGSHELVLQYVFRYSHHNVVSPR
jgi:type IX secretion system PorP/SprF family membrane protein